MNGVFMCSGKDNELLPKALQEKIGVRYPEAHFDKNEMMKLSFALKDYRLDGFLRIPFCVSVEAEALGARINFGDECHGPRVAGYRIESIDELDLFLEKGTELLSERESILIEFIEGMSEREDVMFCLSGSFTVATSIMETGLFYKLIRIDEEKALRLLSKIESHIILLGENAIDAGAKIVSYSDPSGAVDIVGPKVFKKYSGPSSKRILEKLNAVEHKSILHVCAKTSKGLCDFNICESNVSTFSNASYADILKLMANIGGERIVGNRCINGAGETLEKIELSVLRLL